MTVPKCKACKCEVVQPAGKQHHYYCNHPDVQKEVYGRMVPKLVLAFDHNRSPWWYPKRKRGSQ